MRCVLRSQAHVQKERLVGSDHLLGADEVDRGVDNVLGQVITLAVRGLDVVVVQGELRMPLAGLALQETIEAIEAALQRPLVEGARGRGFEGRGQVPLAGRESVVALQPQHLGQRAGTARDAPAHTRKAQVPVGQPAHADRVVVAPGEQGGPRRRTQGGGVEVGVTQPACGQRVDVRRLDLRAVAAQIGEAQIVEHDVDHIGSTRRGADRRGPVRCRLGGGVADGGAALVLTHDISRLFEIVGSAPAQRKPT